MLLFCFMIHRYINLLIRKSDTCKLCPSFGGRLLVTDYNHILMKMKPLIEILSTYQGDQDIHLPSGKKIFTVRFRSFEILRKIYVSPHDNLIGLIPSRTPISLCYAQKLPCIVGRAHINLTSASNIYLIGLILFKFLNRKQCCYLRLT